MTDTEYQNKSAVSGRMGKATEYLVAASCILGTNGVLGVSTSLVDDEGVDLLFHRRGGTAMLAVQVKARMSTTTTLGKDRMLTSVRSQSFVPRPNLDMLFVAVDVAPASIRTAWMMPSQTFHALVPQPNGNGDLRFSASLKAASADQWSPFRIPGPYLPDHIHQRLMALDGLDR